MATPSDSSQRPLPSSKSIHFAPQWATPCCCRHLSVTVRTVKSPAHLSFPISASQPRRRITSHFHQYAIRNHISARSTSPRRTLSSTESTIIHAQALPPWSAQSFLPVLFLNVNSCFSMTHKKDSLGISIPSSLGHLVLILLFSLYTSSCLLCICLKNLLSLALRRLLRVAHLEISNVYRKTTGRIFVPFTMFVMLCAPTLPTSVLRIGLSIGFTYIYTYLACPSEIYPRYQCKSTSISTLRTTSLSCFSKIREHLVELFHD